MSLVRLLAEASTTPSGGSAIATYGPIIAGLASAAAVVVSLLSRKDKQKADNVAAQDSQANTAIKGLTEAYDRVNAERKEEADRADRAEATYRDREVAIRHLESENELLKARNDELQRMIAQFRGLTATRKQAPAKKAVKKTAVRRTGGAGKR